MRKKYVCVCLDAGWCLVWLWLVVKGRWWPVVMEHTVALVASCQRKCRGLWWPIVSEDGVIVNDLL